MILDRVLLGFVYAFVFGMKVLTFIFDLPARLLGGSTTNDDVALRKAAIDAKARRRWIHDVEEARRNAARSHCEPHDPEHTSAA